MDLSLIGDFAQRYKNLSQRARVLTEPWAEENLFCCVCESPRLTRLKHNTPGFDFSCPSCESRYQLKSQRKKFGSTVVGSAYSIIEKAMAGDQSPNLLLLHYDPESLQVRNVILIPSFTFVMSVIERRKPLSPTARRKGWTGYKILLHKIPSDVQIPLVENGKPVPAAKVRDEYERLRPIRAMKPAQRGWALDVLQVVRSLRCTEFNLSDVYGAEPELEVLHPNNGHVRDKIRQQLQVLRDTGFLKFLGRGRYRVSDSP
jgi:type II restriction enzyme